MKYTTFKLITYINEKTPIPTEFHIDALNALTKKEGWKVVTSLYTVGNTSILLLEKKK